MRKLTTEAKKLLQYIYEHKNSACEGLFGISLFSARQVLGQKTVGEITPFVSELVQADVLSEVEGEFKAPRYELIEKNAIKFMKDIQEEKFVQEYRENLEEEIKEHKMHVVTTGVMGKEAFSPFVQALKSYAKINNALLEILPCEDVSSRGRKAAPIELSPELEDFRVIFKDTYLNKNLCLSAIKMTAKQVNPLSGLDRIVADLDASVIVASPKFFLKYIPNGKEDVPKALMTTGAVTVNNYDNDRYMSKRTSSLAEIDHTYGALVIEIEDENIFHFRQLIPAADGSFTDLGIKYYPDGSTEKIEDTVMVMGDSHIGYHDLELHESVMDLAKNAGVSEVILHDIFHGTSISHHEWDKSITRARRAQEGKLDLKRECMAVKGYLEDIESRGLRVTIPQANHHGHLDKYLEAKKYADDPINLEFVVGLLKPAIQGLNALQYAIETLLGFKKDTVKWLGIDESYRRYGIEVGYHGDKGANGGRGSLTTYEKALGKCVVAHSHTAAIQRSVFCVGTVGKMDMDYNKGLSSWTRTCCLVYKDGTRQLVNFIPDKEGNYKYKA